MNMDYLADTIDFYELFDRLIVATARFLDVPMLTSDKEIMKSQIVKVIWE